MTARALTALGVLALAGCTSNQPAVLEACPVDLAVLTACRYPADLPEEPVDAILRLYEALSLCVDTADTVVRAWLESRHQ